MRFLLLSLLLLVGCESSTNPAKPDSGKTAWVLDSIVHVSGEGGAYSVTRFFYDARGFNYLDSTVFCVPHDCFSTRSDFDSRGRLIRDTYRDSEDTTVVEIHYNTAGKESLEVYLDGAGQVTVRWVFEYDAAGRLARKSNRPPNHPTGWLVEERFYGGDTLVDSVHYYTMDGSMSSRALFTYVGSKLVKTRSEYAGSGNGTETTYERRADGKLIEEKNFSLDGLVFFNGTLYEYDAHGNEIRAAVYGKDRSRPDDIHLNAWKQIPAPASGS